MIILSILCLMDFLLNFHSLNRAVRSVYLRSSSLLVCPHLYIIGLPALELGNRLLDSLILADIDLLHTLLELLICGINDFIAIRLQRGQNRKD